ncbi:MAG: hypothetical protein KC684_08410 [Candidatus Omnitrophica bacterium]|nr:hypothetical protein [Candidatus Omnitrophota bacterium]MCA9406546.1 hypothetical protein [Candidatus Omnitrophota bacterium]
MKNITVLTFLAFFVLVFNAAAYTVPDGRAAVLVGQDNITIHKYVEGTGHMPAGFMVYTGIHDLQGLDNWSSDYGAGKANAQELVDRYPGGAIQIGLYMVDSLQKTYNGEFDENIERMARWMESVDVPIFLRIGYEFDGPHNHYDPEDYKKAYIYIVEKLKAMGVDNVDYVWHSYANKEVMDIEPWYPGDEYVDWIALSYFDQPQSFMTHVVDFAKAHDKPLMIAEATPRNKKLHSPLAWKIWFQPFFRFVETNDVKIISYINSHWETMPMWVGQGWGDARIEAYEGVKQLWLEKMKEERYQFRW